MTSIPNWHKASALESPAALAITETLGGWSPYRHLELINERLVSIAKASGPHRFLLEAPVRFGKSTLVSHYFPAWWLLRRPTSRVLIASYSNEHALQWVDHVAHTVDLGRRLTPIDEVQSVPGEYRTLVGSQQGVIRGVGVGGALLGRGFDLVIVDSPIKNMEEAISELHRDRVWDWWESELVCRLNPGARVVVAAERWHPDDLPGRLHKDSAWDVLRLPALAESDPLTDPLGRQPGESLCPEMWPQTRLQEIRTESPDVFAALYQQAPAIPDAVKQATEMVRTADRAGAQQ